MFNASGQVNLANRNNVGKLKRDRKDNCIYCEKNVTNFPRHLTRNHGKEFDVKLLALPKNSVKRRNLVNDIRRQGMQHFIFSVKLLHMPLQF